MATAAVPRPSTMHVVCVEGCHGVGKTEACSHIPCNDTLIKMDEVFITAEVAATSVVKTDDATSAEDAHACYTISHLRELPPQGVTNEVRWVLAWYGRVIEALRRQKQLAARRVSGCSAASADHFVLLTDRSPISAYFYMRHQDGATTDTSNAWLLPMIAAINEELRITLGITFSFIHLAATPDKTWERIQHRIALEPVRRALHEDDREWMERVAAMYHAHPWDLTIDATTDDLEHTTSAIQRHIEQKQHSRTTPSRD